ncbi:hypothetical protein [Streptomyces sp. NPDC021622]|uniref:hypothetical protein n=1 Tax=Streptomyces sp. NPDC021622 TaxID=3155013 RepID=UPI0033DF308B
MSEHALEKRLFGRRARQALSPACELRADAQAHAAPFCTFTGWASRSSRLPGGQSSGAQSASSPLPRGKQESPGFSREKTPYLEAAWYDTPGGPDDPRCKPLNEPTGRVYFAGDWLGYTYAWQHGAFTSVRRAIGKLHARVPAA